MTRQGSRPVVRHAQLFRAAVEPAWEVIQASNSFHAEGLALQDLLIRCFHSSCVAAVGVRRVKAHFHAGACYARGLQHLQDFPNVGVVEALKVDVHGEEPARIASHGLRGTADRSQVDLRVAFSGDGDPGQCDSVREAV